MVGTATGQRALLHSCPAGMYAPGGQGFGSILFIDAWAVQPAGPTVFKVSVVGKETVESAASHKGTTMIYIPRVLGQRCTHTAENYTI